MKQVYHRLTVEARESETAVTVTDTDGHPVASGTGVVNVSVMPGEYLYWYGRDGRIRKVLLDDDINIQQAARHENPDSREGVDGMAYSSPNRPCTDEDCPGRMQWQLGDTWHDKEYFLCSTCEERENVKPNEIILLRDIILDIHNEKEKRNGR